MPGGGPKNYCDRQKNCMLSDKYRLQQIYVWTAAEFKFILHFIQNVAKFS